MFWSDRGDDEPKIECANLDGSKRRAVITRDLIRPHGLALDFDLDRLYWCDALRDVIEYANFDGRYRFVCLEERET